MFLRISTESLFHMSEVLTEVEEMPEGTPAPSHLHDDHNVPDYTGYDLEELLEAQHHLDHEQYPERSETLGKAFDKRANLIEGWQSSLDRKRGELFGKIEDGYEPELENQEAAARYKK